MEAQNIQSEGIKAIGAGMAAAPLAAVDHRATRRQRLMRYQLEALARQAGRVPVPVLLAALVVAATVREHNPWTEILIWLGGICGALLVRWLYSREAKRNSNINTARALSVMTILSLLNGAVTGTAAVAFLPDLPPERQAILTMILVCWSAGAVSANAAYSRAFFAYSIPLLAPLALSWAYSGSAGGVWIALLIVLFLAIEAAFARDNERLFRRSLVIQYRNERLVEKLRKERRAVTHERDRATEANQAKSRFLYSASHDLRQPLSAILINSNVLSGLVDEQKTRRVAEDIRQSARSLNSLLNSLLNISKIDAGTLQPELGPISLDLLLQRLGTEFRPVAEGKGLHIDFSVSSDIVVETDEFWLDDIIRNLLDNAVKYTHSGGVGVRVSKDGRHARIEIWDTGIGIPKEEHERIFEELYQVRRDRSSGHGLGLSIVRRRARELSISISLQSTPGEGSVFILMVPLSENIENPAGHTLEGATEQLELESGIRVLVVDDDERFLRSMISLLDGWGCEVLTAANFDDALALLTDEPIDILLTDYRLPESRSGIEVVQEARRIHAGLPALLISGDTTADPPHQAAALGIDFLTKPTSDQQIHKHMAIALTKGEKTTGEDK